MPAMLMEQLGGLTSPDDIVNFFPELNELLNSSSLPNAGLQRYFIRSGFRAQPRLLLTSLAGLRLDVTPPSCRCTAQQHSDSASHRAHPLLVGVDLHGCVRPCDCTNVLASSSVLRAPMHAGHTWGWHASKPAVCCAEPGTGPEFHSALGMFIRKCCLTFWAMSFEVGAVTVHRESLQLSLPSCKRRLLSW